MSRNSRPSAKGKNAATSSKGPAAALLRPAPHTLSELMTEALIMEVEAAQRYLELADAMETHNNVAVAVLFRKMAAVEGKHAEQIMHEMGWATAPAAPGRRVWQGFEAPETTPHDTIHYLMQPWHALALALAAEQRAERFFASLAQQATTEAVRNAALELQREEEEHVELIREWMTRVAPPETDWSTDPDPPRLLD
jgi:rubrerythrin